MIRVIHRRNLRHKMRAIFIQIPVFLACHIGIMRMGETDRQAPGPRVMTACQIIDLTGGVIGHLIIIFHLIGNLGHTCAGDRSHIVIPPVNPLTGLAIIRRPAKISRINIGGQTFLKPVHLIGADKMHLTRQTGLITRTAQVVGIGGNIGGKFSRIIINPAARWQKARHETCPSRRAQG